MGHFLGLALGMPLVIYTALLGLTVVYWGFVLVGAVHVGEGADGAADGAADGVGGHDVGGHDVGGHDVGDGDVGDGDLGEGHGAGLLAALKLRSAPATVVLSCILFFTWFIGMFAGLALDAMQLGGGALFGVRLALFFVAPMLALFPTSLVVRPLARTLKPVRAVKRTQLVGKLCTIRTGTVTERFGEATLEDGGAGLVVRVRVEAGEKLGRGDQAVIVGYDEDKQEFTVAPLPEVERSA